MPTICNQVVSIFGGDNTVAGLPVIPGNFSECADGVAIRKVALRQGMVDHGYMGAFGILSIAPDPSLQQWNKQDVKLLRANQVNVSQRRGCSGFVKNINADGPSIPRRG